MARRIKEESIVHQNRIALVAAKLFSEKGKENTKMDTIAELAGYSKATLYVYFKNKDEIANFISYKGTADLKELIENAMKRNYDPKETFMIICFSLVEYEKKYPDFFSSSISNIKLSDFDEYLMKAYLTGEEINELIISLLNKVKTNSNLEQVFIIWGMINGVIKIAKEKEAYLKSCKININDFLLDGFNKIYNSIAL